MDDAMGDLTPTMKRSLISLALLAAAGTAHATTSVARYLEVDRTVGVTADALPAFAAAAGRVRDCPPAGADAGGHVRCLLAALGELRTDGDGKLSTLLLERRSDPYSVAAALLLLHGRVATLQAVVFGPRVLVGIRGDRSRYFDPMDGGRELTIGLAFATHGLPFSRAEEADVDRFLAYYADRHAVAASSEPLFKLAVKTTPASGRIRYDYGAWLLRQNRLDDARSQLGSATRLDPDHFEAWMDRGTVLAKLGRLKPARKSFVQALRVDPRSKAAADQLRAIDARIDAAVDEQLD